MRRVWPALIFVAACHGELVPIEGSRDDPPPGAGADAAAGVAFRSSIQDDLDDNGCTAATCHALLGTPMRVVAAPTEESDWQANYDAIVARSGNAEASLLIAKPSGLGGHITVLAPSSPVIQRWIDWIGDGVPFE